MLKKRRMNAMPTEPDMVPMMNLVTILIPFLVMSMQLVSLAVIDSTLPAISKETPQEEIDEDDKPLSLSLVVSGDGFMLDGADDVLSEEEGGPGKMIECLEVGCPTPESYDYAELTARLVKIKDKYDTERDQTVILVPSSRTQYEVIIHSMDACREDRDSTDAEGKPRLLFPFVVIAGGVE